MSDNILLTRRNMMTAAAGGSAIAVAFAAPSVTQGLTDIVGSFGEDYTSPYSNLSYGDHNDWEAQRGKTLTTADGHSLQVLEVTKFVPFGRRVRGVLRSRAFAVDFQLVAGAGMTVEKIHSVRDESETPMDLYLTAVGDRPGRIRAMFN